jgi:hypothetical protein
VSAVRQRLGIAAVGLLAALATSCTLNAETIGAVGSFDRTLSVMGPVDLSVRTGSGSIHIQAGDSDHVRIVGQIRARGVLWSGLGASEQVRRLEASPPIEQTGNAIEIGNIKDLALRQNISISYELTVPPETRVRSQTGSGNQSIDDLRGPLEAETGSGSIRVGRIGERVSASTGSGHIELGGARGLDAHAGSGSIRAEGVGGPIKARTGSGRIELAQTAPGDVDVSTGSGRVTVAGVQGAARLRAGSGDILVEGQPLGDWNVHTGSGSVTVHLPTNAAFELDAQTGSGSIETARPVQVLGKLSRRRLQGKVGGGGARLELSTSSGSIRID